MPDLDQGGFNFQRVNAYLGPSLGWVPSRIKPERFITVSGTYNATPDDGVIFVNVSGTVIITLPDVTGWMPEPAYQPATAFERTVWIKDLGGHAGAFPIQVFPFGNQAIDTLHGSVSINTNNGILRLYPLADLSGWFLG
jgi:hypothetical protein